VKFLFITLALAYGVLGQESAEAVAPAVEVAAPAPVTAKPTEATTVATTEAPVDIQLASEEEANNEFFAGISEDAMMTEVLADVNNIHIQLANSGMTKASGGESLDCSEYEDMEEESAEYLLLEDDQIAEFKKCKDASEDQIKLKNQEEQLRRFVELKQLVSWMQPKDKRISRYCFYGCWCLPEGAHSFVAGEGKPVDLVDRACQYLWFCYTCAKQDFKGIFGGRVKYCVPDAKRYAFRFSWNVLNKHDYTQRDIKCKDPWYRIMDAKFKQRSNCARAICECDRGLAMRLYKVWKHWDKSRHRIWSQKVTTCAQLTACNALPQDTVAEQQIKTACLKRGCLFIVKQRCLHSDRFVPSPDHELICCGLYEDDGGRIEMRDHGGTHFCCDHDQGAGSGLPWYGNWLNSLTHCCKDGVPTILASC